MNKNPQAIRVLCYGDSNTWGHGGNSKDRYPTNVRWTGRLQEKLGEKYEVIEEGLCGRTTDLDDDSSTFSDKNGLNYLPACLDSQSPLDLVILMLGTNDLKPKFDRSAQDIAQAIDHLLELIQTVTKKIILVSPPHIREDRLKPDTNFRGAGAKSHQLAGFFKEVAEKRGCGFVDIAAYVQPGDADGVHLESEMHPIVAEVLYKKIRDINFRK